jgi:alpha-L-arabinofuranosidase
MSYQQTLRSFLLSGLLLLGTAATAAEAQLTVDLAKPGAAISPNLYGQFIEHVGRCIHDGIWAEKLRDRKFLLSSGKVWEVIKSKDGDVFHDTAGAYAGDHCMAVWLRKPGGQCGVRQGGIGLVAGQEYVGYAIIANVAQPAPVKIRLAWGNTEAAGQTIVLNDVSRKYTKFPLRFRAGATTDAATLSVTVDQPAYLWLGGLSLMPADNVGGMRADTLRLVRQLKPPIMRWPGGNFVSGYNWKDAVGPRDRRPPRWERAWNDVEDNDFGIDEFMAFCKAIDTQAYVAVNTGLGSVADAADEVEYATGPADSRWGAKRAHNGHPEPYRIMYWGIGNEMYGNWQLGNVPVERYALRHNAFVAAMRDKSPDIKVIAVGAPGGFNDVMLPACAKYMDLLSGHHYSDRKLRMPLSNADAAAYERGFATYSGCVAGGVRGLAADFRKRLDTRNPDVARVRLAIDEWGIVRDWNLTPDTTGIGAFEHYYCLGDAIAIARGLHEIIRSADVVAMANWAQTVNVVGMIKTSRTRAVLDPGGHVLALYRGHLGGTLAPAELKGAPQVDAIATWDQARGKLSLGLVNYSPQQETAVAVRLPGAAKAGSFAGWRINGPALGSINVPGQPEAVTTTRIADLPALEGPIILPPHSITVLEREY